MGSPFAQPIPVASQPTGGQGLALTPDGKIPHSLLRVNGVTGTFDSAAAVVAGGGFSVSRSATGTYVVTFTRAFSAAPTVICQAYGATGIGTGIGAISASSVTVDTFSTTTGSAANGGVSFIAVATQ